ncbi:MAG: hypothetical protein WCF90_10720 [Methanomicrobiales archaeon]
MSERFFQHTTNSVIKGLSLEWKCPNCEGLNFKIILRGQRRSGDYHTCCRCCKSKYRLVYPTPEKEIEGDVEFLERLYQEDLTREEELDMIKDFDEILQ